MTSSKPWVSALRRVLVVAVWLGVAASSAVCCGDEGMWLFNHLPRRQMAEKYGFVPSDAWLEHVMKSSVRFNSGGSGSFVSSTGLVLTNHHVGADTLQKISTAEQNYYKEGFLARNLADERKAPDLELNVLQSIEDVTELVNGAVRADMSPAEAFAARRAAIATIEKNSFEKTGLRSDVVTLYQGGQYHLYRYKRYTDIRLVFAPEFDIAFFGGDPDNFEYPRYNLDICLFRVYENDRPAKIEHFLKWSPLGAADGELVFVSGHPGRTDRLNTVAALKYIRDHQSPVLLDWLRRQEILLQQFSYQGNEQARIAQEELFGIQNSRKAFYGRLAGLQDPAILARKIAAEEALRAKLASNPQWQAEFGDAWEKIAQTQEIRRQLATPVNVLEFGRGFESKLFMIARTLVRLAEENEKPNPERLPEFTDAARDSLELELYSTAPIHDDLEQTRLADSLGYLLEQFGGDHPLAQTVLAGKSPWDRATELILGTKLKQVEERKRIAEGGRPAITQSKDPMIALARLVDPAARAARKKFEEEVVEVERQAYGKIARALFALYGTELYPDATFTLRLSFGVVKGYEEGGKTIPPWTTFGGAFHHADLHGNKPPWDLPERWRRRKDSLRLETPFNFVSTCDIIGGNSGSPVINREAEFVGIIFDGNLQSLVGDFIYDESQNRAVAVHSAAILEALRTLYDAEALASELGR